MIKLLSIKPTALRLFNPSAAKIIFFISSSLYPRNLHSFPTRRSSDPISRARFTATETWFWWRRQAPVMRSEEHTSELQSRVEIVCRVLLEKKKNYGEK